MKRLFLVSLILLSTCLYAYGDTEVVGGGGGVTEGSDVGFGNITATSLSLAGGISSSLSGSSSDFNLESAVSSLTIKGATIGLVNSPGAWGVTLNSAALQLYGDRKLEFVTDDSSYIPYLKYSENGGLGLNTEIDETTGQSNVLTILSNHSTTGDAAATDLLIKRNVTSTGSGDQLLIDAQVDDVSKFSVDTAGNITANSITFPKVYANLSNTADQTFASTGTGYAILFNSNDNLVGITHSTSVDTENITIVTSGVYSINAQPQVTAGAAGDFHMWLQVDTGGGFADVANSNVKLALAINNEGVIPLTLTIPLDAGDIVRLMGSVSNTGVILDANAPGGEPVIPAIICSMHKI